MSIRRVGERSIRFESPPSIISTACVVGKKEGEGPLSYSFDYTGEDGSFCEKTWERAESEMVKRTLGLALSKAKLDASAVDVIFAGDLLNQCIGSTFGLREFGIPCLGLYGACSTMAEALTLAAMSIDGGFAQLAAAEASSHFCTAERQYRYPLEYGSIRPPSAQWTVTGCGAALLSAHSGNNSGSICITGATIGRITDAGVTDANNMGAGMAPAACDTIAAYLRDTETLPSDYDMILTGDLGSIGHSILLDLMADEGLDISSVAQDCGRMIFSDEQDVHAGGSGCGCSASVLCGHIMDGLKTGRWKKILFAGTGSMQSPVSLQQGESMPAICHLVCIENTEGGK